MNDIISQFHVIVFICFNQTGGGKTNLTTLTTAADGFGVVAAAVTRIRA